MKKTSLPKISQSLIKDILDTDVCPLFIKLKYIDHVETKPSEAMKKGQYFEHHLIGKTRSGVEPKYEPRSTKNKSGDFRPEAQVTLDDLIIWARGVLTTLGFDLTNGEAQIHVEAGDISGHLDLRTNDIIQKDRKCVVDVKFTDTAADDRWNGWAMFMEEPSANWKEKLQAVHYTVLHHAKFGSYVPFYFAVFSSKGWCRIIKVEVTEDMVAEHKAKVELAKLRLEEMAKEGFPRKSKFVKCTCCPMFEACPQRILLPEIEVYAA